MDDRLLIVPDVNPLLLPDEQNAMEAATTRKGSYSEDSPEGSGDASQGHAQAS